MKQMTQTNKQKTEREERKKWKTNMNKKQNSWDLRDRKKRTNDGKKIDGYIEWFAKVNLRFYTCYIEIITMNWESF